MWASRESGFIDARLCGASCQTIIPRQFGVYWDIGRKLPSGTLLVQFAWTRLPLSRLRKKFRGPFRHYPPAFPPRATSWPCSEMRTARLRYRLLCCSGKEDYCDMPAVEKQRKMLPAIASSRLNRWIFCVYKRYDVYCLTFRARIGESAMLHICLLADF